MSDLNDEARSLFDAARAGYEPNEGDGKRVLRGVLLRAGVVVGVTSATRAGAAAGAPLASGAASSGGLALKAALWLAIGASVGIGGYAISRVPSGSVNVMAASTQAHAGSTSTSRPSAPARVAPGAAEVAPANVEDAATEHSQGSRPNTSPVSRAPGKGSPSSRASSASFNADRGGSAHAIGADTSGVAAFPLDAPSGPAGASGADASSLALSVEARALAEVQRDLKEGKNAEALRLVEAQRQQFAHGELQPERDAAKIVALCAVGRVADARAAARAFLANSPRSPFAARIRASCAGQ